VAYPFTATLTLSPRLGAAVLCLRNTLSAGAGLNSRTMRKESASTISINPGAGSKAASHKNQVSGGHIPVPPDLTNDDLTGQREGFYSESRYLR